MKRIYYLQKHEVKLGDVIEHNGFRAIVTEELIKFFPELFVVKDSMQELLDKAKRDYPIGTMFNSEYGVQKVLSGEPFIGIVIPGTVQINTDRFTGGATIYTPEDGWAEVLPIKFITEDGIRIYGDMRTYLVGPNNNVDICSRHDIWCGNTKRESYKYFYHKENALAYIKKHKEKTLRDYENMLFERGNSVMSSSGSMYFSVYGWLKDTEPKLYYTKILQLIADHLNDGWVADFSKGGTKWFIKESDSDWTILHNYGAVYFKSKELSEKARSILGDKVKYLFK